MYIKNISLRNYRNFFATKLFFKKDCVNTIVGENSSGKTNVFEAMRLIIDDTLPYYKRFLSTSDFNRNLEDPFGHWVIISLELDDIGGEEESQILCQLNTTIDGGGTGRVTYIYRPQYVIRKMLYEISSIDDFDERKLKFQEIKNNSSISKISYEAIVLYQGCCDFTDDSDYRDVVGDFVNLKFPNPENEEKYKLGNRQRGYFLQEHIGCTYARALRDVVSELKNNRFNPFQKLLEFISKDMKNDELLSENIIDINKKISSITEVKNLSNGILQSINTAVGSTFSPNLNISSELPSDIKDLVNGLQLRAGDSLDDGYVSDLSEMSLGGANLIYLALKLYEYEEGISQRLLANFLIIEEPESHIHTHIQKSLFSNLSNKKTQVFISTHSTHISSVSKVSSTNILIKTKNGTESCFPSNGLEQPLVDKIERFLDAIRTDILFAKSVILIEGDAEEILIPHIVRNAFGVSLDELGVSLVSVRGTGFELLASLFNEKRVRKNCAILTDNDVCLYEKEKPDYLSDREYEKALASQKKGIDRSKSLTLFTENNTYVSAYYTQYTFEIDLALSGAAPYMLKIAEESYKKEAFLEPYREAFKSDDPEKIGSYALKLANKLKKGWFAMMLSSEIDSSFPVPEALCMALGFTSKFNFPMFIRILKHRMNYLSDDSVKNIINDIFGSIDNIPQEELDTVKHIFYNEYPSDPLTILMQEQDRNGR